MLRDDEPNASAPVSLSDPRTTRPSPNLGENASVSESGLVSEAADVEAREPEVRPRPERRHEDDDGPGEKKIPDDKKQDKAPEKDDAKDDDEDNADDNKPGFVRRHPFIVAAIVIGLIAAAILGYFYWLIYIHPYESTDDAFIDSREFAISPKVSGYIVAVPVTDNQTVGAGSPVAQIDDRDYRIALEQAEAQVSGSQATLEGLVAQISGQQAQVEEAKSQVVQAQAQAKFAEQDAARYQDLAARGAGTIQQAQQATSNLQQQQANLSRYQSAVTAAQKQITALLAQQSNGSANLLLAKAQLDQSRLNLTYTTVTAAQAGTVVRLSAAQGAYATAGQNLMMFVPATIWVTANFKETQITDMRPGQHVDLRIDAYPDRKINGRLDSVQPGSGTAFSLLPAENATGNYVKVVQRVPVKIVFDNLPPDIVLGPGMSVVPTVRVR